jgi:hypothetical protein
VFGPLVGNETCHAHFVASFTHNAEHPIMPRTPLNRLQGKRSVSMHSA